MTTPRHTPGPWVIDDAFKTSTVITNDTGIVICQIHGCGPGATADGHLITAAPDLLEAISKFVAFAERHGEVVFSGGGMSAIDAMNACTTKARAAIAKATGG